MNRSLLAILPILFPILLSCSLLPDAANPPLSVREIMAKVIDPSADLVWGAAGTVEDENGSHDLAPNTEADWVKLSMGAKRLAEGANMLLSGDLRIAPPGAKSAAPGIELEPEQVARLVNADKKTFRAFAIAIRDLASEAEMAALQKNAKPLLDIGSRLDAVCESCHRTFWYPDQKSAHLDFLRTGMMAKKWERN